MESAAQSPASPKATAAANREEDPDPEPGRRVAGPIQEHHFVRPVVSPVGPDVRTAPRDG